MTQVCLLQQPSPDWLAHVSLSPASPIMARITKTTLVPAITTPGPLHHCLQTAPAYISWHLPRPGTLLYINMSVTSLHMYIEYQLNIVDLASIFHSLYFQTWSWPLFLSPPPPPPAAEHPPIFERVPVPRVCRPLPVPRVCRPLPVPRVCRPLIHECTLGFIWKNPHLHNSIQVKVCHIGWVNILL